MKLVHLDLSGAVLKDDLVFSEWIIESPELFAAYIQEIYGQYGKHEGRFVLSQNMKEMDISKYFEIIINPFAVELNGKKILNRLYAELSEQSCSEVMYTKTLELAGAIQEYLLELECNTEHILQFDSELDVPGLLKVMNVKLDDSEGSFFERLVCYIKNVVNVLSVKVFVFINLRSYLSDKQMQELVKEIAYREVQALFIENQERTCLEGGMRYIIDKDGCEIF